MAQNSINNKFLGVGVEDAFNNYQNATPQTYTKGIDTSDSDSLKITDGATPSAGSTMWRMSTSGQRIVPLQPAFYASLAVTVPAVTGNATVYECIFDTLAFSQNQSLPARGYDVATGRFHVDQTGFYRFSCSVSMGPLGALNTTGTLLIGVNGGVTNVGACVLNPFAVATPAANITLNVSGEINLTAGDYVSCFIQVLGAAATVDFRTASSFFSGVLLC